MDSRIKLRLGVLGQELAPICSRFKTRLEDGTLDAEIVCVVSDVPGARILERAAEAGIDAAYIDAAPFKTKLEGVAERKYIDYLEQHDVEVVVLAGFMRIIKPGFLSSFPNRVVNIHPALLPSFPGRDAWKQALNYGAKITGCTVHFVDAGTDTGPIILQKSVLFAIDDTPETLHPEYSKGTRCVCRRLRLLAAGRLKIEARVKSGI